VIAMMPLADLDKTWARNKQNATDNTRCVYESFLRY
jgi:hypothetical protein